MPLLNCNSPLPNMAECCSPLTVEKIVERMFNDWVTKNGRKPLYFVTSPDDWYLFISRAETYRSSPRGKNKLQGVPVLVNAMVPVGCPGFVG